MSDLHREARQIITLLNLPLAVEKCGAEWCSTMRLLLTLSLNSCTQLEADERITKICGEVYAKLGAGLS